MLFGNDPVNAALSVNFCGYGCLIAFAVVFQLAINRYLLMNSWICFGKFVFHKLKTPPVFALSVLSSEESGGGFKTINLKSDYDMILNTK